GGGGGVREGGRGRGRQQHRGADGVPRRRERQVGRGDPLRQGQARVAVTQPIDRGLAKTFAGHIHWRACGNGPVGMISHINQQSSAPMIELLPAPAPNFRPIPTDYPSTGLSDQVAHQPTIEDYARCVIEVMDSLSIERAFALGEAVGAGVSYALGANYKQRIDKVVAINTPYFGTRAQQDIAD